MPADLLRLKSFFFDRAGVAATIDPAARRALSKFGAFTARRARTSIRRKTGTSPAGGPPFAHQGDIKRILFAYDPGRKSVVTGFIPYGSRSGAPEALEHGGSTLLRRKGRPGRRVTIRPRPTIGPAAAAELTALGNDFRNLIR